MCPFARDIVDMIRDKEKNRSMVAVRVTSFKDNHNRLHLFYTAIIEPGSFYVIQDEKHLVDTKCKLVIKSMLKHFGIESNKKRLCNRNKREILSSNASINRFYFAQ